MRKLTPYITEKSVELTKSGKFTLVVDYNANKKEVESLVKEFYKVTPLSVKILKTKYLPATKHRKQYLDRGVKKAIVELEKGKTIPGFEFETKEDKKDAKVTKTNRKENGKES